MPSKLMVCYLKRLNLSSFATQDVIEKNAKKAWEDTFKAFLD